MNVATEFDKISKTYTADISRWVPNYKKMISGVVSYLPSDFFPHRILDLGCGNGNVTALLIQQFPHAEVVIVDASANMLEECQQRFQHYPDIRYQQAYFQELELPKETFDLVVSGIALHHLNAQEKSAFFPKVLEWLRPGGCFSFCDLMIDKEDEPFHSEHLALWEQQAKENGTSDEEWQWLMDHYNQYDHPSGVENQIRWLQEAGFSKSVVSWRLIGWTNIVAFKSEKE